MQRPKFRERWFAFILRQAQEGTRVSHGDMETSN